jgi:ribosomal protein L29
MKKQDIKMKSEAELLKALESSILTIREVRFAASGSKAKNVKEIANHKKNIARIHTALRAKQGPAR